MSAPLYIPDFLSSSRYTLLFFMPSKRSLELRRQVGQLLIMGFDGTAMSSRLRVMLDKLQPGGIILFKRNLEHAEQTHALLSEAQKSSATPMFLCVDMEGGTVDRLRDVIAPVPSVAEVAATGSKKLFRKHGTTDRRRGPRPRIQHRLRARARSAIRSIKERSDLAHRFRQSKANDSMRVRFCGACATATFWAAANISPDWARRKLDSHAELPVIDKPWKRLWKEDLRPYRELRRELPFVMVAHACLSAGHRRQHAGVAVEEVDERHPA